MPDLQVDLQAAALGQGLLQSANQSAADATTAELRLDRNRVNPAPVTIVAAHHSPHDGSIDIGHEKQVALFRELLADGRGWIVVRRATARP
jgi:hypothetical protein